MSKINEKNEKNAYVDHQTMCDEVYGQLKLVYAGCGHVGGMLEDLVTDDELKANSVSAEELIIRLMNVGEVIDQVMQEVVNLGAYVDNNKPRIVLVH